MIMDNLFYYEGNFSSQNSIYGIATIQEFKEEYSLKEYIKDNEITEIEFNYSEKEKGKYFVEIGSNVSGTREIAFCDNIEEAKKTYKDMVELHFEGLSMLSKPLEDYLIIKSNLINKDCEILNNLKKHLKIVCN